MNRVIVFAMGLTLGWGVSELTHRVRNKGNTVGAVGATAYPCSWVPQEPGFLEMRSISEWRCVRDGEALATISKFPWSPVYNVNQGPGQCIIKNFISLATAKQCVEKELAER